MLIFLLTLAQLVPELACLPLRACSGNSNNNSDNRTFSYLSCLCARAKQVAMLAVTGILVQSFVRFPGFPPFPVSDAARPLAVLKGFMSDEMNSVLLVLLVIGAVELTIGKQVCVCVRAFVCGRWLFSWSTDRERCMQIIAWPQWCRLGPYILRSS